VSARGSPRVADEMTISNMHFRDFERLEPLAAKKAPTMGTLSAGFGSVLEKFDINRLASRRLPSSASDKPVRTWRVGERKCADLKEGDVVGKYGETFVWTRNHKYPTLTKPLWRWEGEQRLIWSV
jgi:hypothetical protein